jgi:HEAT repeat protein
VADRKTLIARALKRDYAAVDALVAEGADALEDVMAAMAASEVSTTDTLGEVVRRVATKESAGTFARYLKGEGSLEAFIAAADALARVGDPVGALKQFAESPAGETQRGIAVRALGRTGDAKNIPAIKSLVKTAEEAGEHVLVVDGIEGLIALGDHSMDAKVAELLASRKVEPKLRAAGLLPSLFYPDLLDTLRSAAKQRNAEIRRHAIAAFQYLGTRRAAEEIAALIKDRDAPTREQAVARFFAVTGVESETREDATTVAATLKDDVCHHHGKPLDVKALAAEAAPANTRAAVVEELRVITGHEFDFNPSRPDGDAAAVDRITRWAAANADRFTRGKCYKLGHEQDLSALR